MKTANADNDDLTWIYRAIIVVAIIAAILICVLYSVHKRNTSLNVTPASDVQTTQQSSNDTGQTQPSAPHAVVSNEPSSQGPTANTKSTASATPSRSSQSGAPSTYCSTTTIQYGTIRKDDPTITLGQSYTTPGQLGHHYFCSKSSSSPGMDDTVQPIDEVYHLGTKSVPVPTQSYQSAPSGYSASQCANLAGAGSAYDVCLAGASRP